MTVRRGGACKFTLLPKSREDFGVSFGAWRERVCRRLELRGFQVEVVPAGEGCLIDDGKVGK